MKTGDFQAAVNHEKVVAAIAAAELRTSGEIRVVVSRQACDDPVARAREAFQRHGMAATRERNAVLIYIAPKSQCFAIVGDEGVHQRCGDSFWQQVAQETGQHFRQGDYTGGLVLAVQRVGDLLAEHFPRRADDVNELPDTLEEH